MSSRQLAEKREKKISREADAPRRGAIRKITFSRYRAWAEFWTE